jgi:hypothetical protein
MFMVIERRESNVSLAQRQTSTTALSDPNADLNRSAFDIPIAPLEIKSFSCVTIQKSSC